ncbi:HptB-dependent secretion and biofilm anti anti-sigma factor [Gammaproteobacteria bacterium]
MTVSLLTNKENRSRNRIYCGIPVQFEQDYGNALDITNDAIFIVLPTTPVSKLGQEGILYIHDNGHIFEEPGIVVRVTETGIVVASLKQDTILSNLLASDFGDVVYIDYRNNETRASLLGYLDADLLNDFIKIYDGCPQPFRYILDFKRVCDVAPSGLAMLLQLSFSPSGRNDVQIINCSEKVTEILKSVTVPGTGIVINEKPATLSESTNKFFVTIELNKKGGERVTVLMPETFDYDARIEFSRLYQNRSKNSEYVLDFSLTKYLAKSAFGTLLLMYKYIGSHQASDIKILHCNPKIKNVFKDMELEKFFYFVDD